MRKLRILSNLPLILVLSARVKALKWGALAADTCLREACTKGCEKCEARGGCSSVESCPVTDSKQRLERVLEALADQQTRLNNLKG